MRLSSRSLRLLALVPALFCLAAGQIATADVVSIGATKDNSMYSENPGASNGAGDHIFAGNTNFGASRRALLSFDVAGAVPAGSVINSVTLDFNISMAPPGAPANAFTLHKLLADWGEGASDAPGAEGAGTPAEPGDATWSERFFGMAMPWTTAGGDFVAASSATATAPAWPDLGPISWGSTAGMVADAQDWLDNPAGNFGWLVMGDESDNATARRFDSRTNPAPANQPVLTIDYSEGGPVCGDGIVEAPEECDEGPANSNDPGATCREDCTLAGCGDNIVDPDEECDEGAANSNAPGATCREDCSLGGCGDGIVDPGEECDLGQDNSDDPGSICFTDCTFNPDIDIPTVSEWGAIIMGVLFLAVGVLVFRYYLKP